MSLRPFFIASSLILSPLAAIGFESASFANSTVDIPLNLTVPSTVSITSTATSDASSLQNAIQLAQTGTQSAKISDINIASNVQVTLTASSVNNGNLTNSSTGATVPYKIAVTTDGGATPNSSSFVTVSSLSTVLSSGARYVYIEVNNPGGLAAGSYTDNLVLTVAAAQ